MSGWLWALTVLAGLYVAGRVIALIRGAPDASEIRYHWNHWLGRLAWATSPRPRRPGANWKMTFGRHTYVRFAEITGESRAHEFWHSLDMHRRSIPVAVVHYVYQYLRYGYRQSPVEVKAREFAEKHKLEFPERHA